MNTPLPWTIYLTVLLNQACLWDWTLGGLVQQCQLDIFLGVHQSCLGTASQNGLEGLWGRASKCSLPFICGHPSSCCVLWWVKLVQKNIKFSLPHWCEDGQMEVWRCYTVSFRASGSIPLALCFVASLCSMWDLAVSEWLAFILQMEAECECILQAVIFYPQSCLPEIWNKLLTQMCDPGKGSRANQECTVMPWEMKLLHCICDPSVSGEIHLYATAQTKHPWFAPVSSLVSPWEPSRVTYCSRTNPWSAGRSLCLWHTHFWKSAFRKGTEMSVFIANS